MRFVNAITAALSMLLFLIHLIWGALSLAGLVKGGSKVFHVLSVLMLLLVAVHVIIGIKLTADTLIASKRAGVSYVRANALFWTRRISGLALLVFMLLHVLTFMGRNVNGVYLLNDFGRFQLAVQILMVAALLLHLICNITHLRIALGIEDKAGIRTDIMMVLAVLLFIAAAAFVVYYLRWIRV